MSDPQVPESLNLNLAASVTPSDVLLEVAASPASGHSTSGTPTSAGVPGSSPMSPVSVSGANIAQLNLEQPPTALDWEEVGEYF